MKYPSLLILAPLAGLLAAPGDLDPHYDAGGRHLVSPYIVAAVRTSDGSLVLAGTSPIHSAGGTSLYRILPDGRLDSSFGTNTGFKGIGRSPVLCESGGGRILVGNAVGGLQPPVGIGVMAVDRSGRLDPSFHLAPEINFPGTVSALAALEDGRVIIGRSPLAGISDRQIPLVSRVLENGGLDLAWNSNLIITSTHPATVRAVLPLQNRSLLVAGRFLVAGETRVRSLVRLLEDGRMDPEFHEPEAVQGREVMALTRIPDGIAAIARDRSSFVLRLDSSGETDPAFANWQGRPRLRSLDALTPAPGGVAVGGADGVATLEWAGDPQPLPWLTVRSTGPGVVSLFRDPDGALLIAGSFDQAGDRWRPGIVKVSADGELLPNFARVGPAVGNRAADTGLTRALLLPDTRGRLLVAGRFTQYNGELRSGLARLGPDGSLDVAFNPELPTSAQPVALALAADGDLLVGLSFQRTPGSTAPLIKLRDADGRQDRSFAADLDRTPSVFQIGVASNGWIYAGRTASEANGRIVRLLPDGSRDSGFIASGQPTLLGVHSDGRILVRDDQAIRRLLPDGQPDPSFAAIPAPQVSSLTILPDDSILAAGTLLDGPWMAARWFSDGRLDTSFQPPRGTATRALAGTLDRVLLLGTFRGRLVRCLPGGELEAGFRVPRGVGFVGEPVVQGNWLHAVTQDSRGGVITSAERIARTDVSAFDFAITGLSEAETTLQRMAPRGRQYVLEESLNLHSWNPIATNTVPLENTITWKVPRPSGTSGHYFRTTEIPSP